MKYAEKLKAIDDYAALKLTRAQFYKIIGADVYFAKKYAPDIRAAETLRANKISKRALEVVYITGGSGSGKSTACKYFSEKLGFDICGGVNLTTERLQKAIEAINKYREVQINEN